MSDDGYDDGRAAAAKASAEAIDLMDNGTIERLSELADGVVGLVRYLEDKGADRPTSAKLVSGYVLGFVFDYDKIIEARDDHGA
jgi:hypothetical protein